LAHFTGKTYPLDSLILNGCNGISGPGVRQLLTAFNDTLIDFEAALNDQPIFSSAFFDMLGHCFNLETLDVTGSNGIDDEGIRQLTAVAITVGNDTVKPGLKYCHTLKMSNAKITDAVLPSLVKCMPNLEHVELCKCEGLGEFGIGKLLSDCEQLIYLDINKVPIVNYGFLDELKNSKPDLLIRRNVHQDDDFKKDNGLRVPRRII